VKFLNEEALTAEKILAAAEEVLRRFGPDKANVIDVAKALGVSHGTIYRHFPSKAALLEAVVERWLGRIISPLAVIAAEDGPAAERLQRWFDILVTLKRRKLGEDPELFATYLASAGQPYGSFIGEAGRLKTHIAKILDDGIRQGVFSAMDAAQTGAAIFDATLKFHHPAHAGLWNDKDIDSDFDNLWRLILRGLGVRKS
jgi:AcrR family transcriptional regulator